METGKFKLSLAILVVVFIQQVLCQNEPFPVPNKGEGEGMPNTILSHT